MSKEKFTPGEWGIFGSGEHGFVYITDNPQKDIQDKHIICQVQTNTKHSTIANAHLLAASPKMYKKLEEIYNAFFTLSFRALQSENEKGANWFMKKAMEIEKILREARGEE
ncbi:MAG: hypothetical protein IJW08_05995 [Lentisphaeria bacterium]|nr:hypothetical protein [Lentisphaeria bacterium]